VYKSKLGIIKMKLDQSIQALVIAKLLLFFSDKCSEKSTWNELISMSASDSLWVNAHGLFRRIRQKTLRVERSLRNPLQIRRAHYKTLECQYLFEEICAKTLYNLSGAAAPFDEESPEWIVPNALNLAKQLGVQPEAMLGLVQAQQGVQADNPRSGRPSA
jgi:hypothetical protein